MKSFSSFDAFVLELAEVSAREIEAEHIGLEAATKLLQTEAKAELGTYQTDIQPFVDWEELRDSTKADRVRQGFTENDPGLRSGEMRDSIERQVHGSEGVVGSNDDHLVYFELGTEKQSPRSVLGSAGVRNADKVRDMIGEAVFLALTGRHVHEGRIDLAAERGD